MTTRPKYRALSFAYPGGQGTLAAAAAPPAVEAKASAAAFGPESGEIKVELAKWEAMEKKEEEEYKI